MESRAIRILMTDDHPMIIEGYKNTLLATKKEYQHLIIDVAQNADESINAIQKSIEIKTPYDLFFFDVSIPASTNREFTSGLDLAAYVIEKAPRSKIIILTMFEEPYRINKILKQINPEALLIKSDLTATELSSAFQRVLNNEIFYSSTVNTVIKKLASNKINLDVINHEILYLISISTKVKDIAKKLNLSESTIEKRKKNIKILFSVDEQKDEMLILEAKKRGYIN